MRFTFQEWKNRSIKSGCVESDFTPEICFNAGQLIAKINALGYKPAKIFSSCLRSKSAQIRIYKEKGITDISKIPMGSAHLSGCAVDIADDGSFQKWLKEHPDYLELQGLYCEDFAYTKNWVHIQSVSPKSGKRFFKP